MTKMLFENKLKYKLKKKTKNLKVIVENKKLGFMAKSDFKKKTYLRNLTMRFSRAR